MSRPRRWWPVLFLALVPILPLWRAVFLGEAIGPFDQIQQMAPWNGPAPTQAWDVLQADGVLQFYAWRGLVFESWGKGQLPLWNPYELCGTPLLGDSQSAAFYLPHILIGVLHVPTPAALTFLAWLHLFWAGLGVFVLARRIGAQRTGAVVGGTAFMLSAFMLSWSALPSVISTVAWIPWVLAGVYGLGGRGGRDEGRGTRDEGSGIRDQGSGIRGQGSRDEGRGTRDKGSGIRDQGSGSAGALDAALSGHGAAEGAASQTPDHRPPTLGPTPHTPHPTPYPLRPTPYALRLTLLAVSVAMMLLAGHLQFAAYGLMSAALLAAWLCAERLVAGRDEARGARDEGIRGQGGAGGRRADVRRAFGGLALTFLGVVLGAMLAAPQLLPVLNYSKFSHRAGPPTDAGYEDFAGGALKPFELTGLVYPGLLGDPTAHIPELDVKPSLSAYWPQYAKRGSNFAETALSLGPVVVLLLCFLRRRHWRRAAPLVGIGVAGLLVATGTPLAKMLYFLVPGWSATGSTGRAGVLLVLAACTVAALGVDDEERGRDAKAYAPLLVFGGLTALFILALQACGSMVPIVPAMVEGWASIVKLATASEAKVAVLAGAVCLVAAFVLLRFPRWSRVALLAAAVAVPLFLCGKLVRTGDPAFLTKLAPNPDRYAFINDDWEIPVAAHALMPPNTAVAQRMHDVAGYDSLLHRDTVAMLRDIDGKDLAGNDIDPAPPANGNMMFVKHSADPKKLAEAGVTEVWSLRPLPRFGRPLSELDGVIRYRLAGPGRASTPSGPATIVEDGFDSVVVRANGPGKLVVRDRKMDGRRAEVDGRPANLSGSTWLEVELPAGSHSVSFPYRPPGLDTGCVCLLVAGGCLGASLLWGRRRTVNEPNTA